METNISTVQVVLMGLITVFVVLICLIVIIKILGLIMEKVAKKQPAPAAAPAPAPAAAGGTTVEAPMPGTTSRSLPLSQSRSPRRWARTFRTSASIPSKESEMRKARNLTDER